MIALAILSGALVVAGCATSVVGLRNSMTIKQAPKWALSACVWGLLTTSFGLGASMALLLAALLYA